MRDPEVVQLREEVRSARAEASSAREEAAKARLDATRIGIRAEFAMIRRNVIELFGGQILTMVVGTIVVVLTRG